MTKEEQKRMDDLEHFLGHAKIAVPWMVDSMVVKHSDGVLNESNYSDELKHAILLKERVQQL